jgi:hemerythrin-like domain-containing protein
LALGQNFIIRGLNSIYKQASNIGSKDVADFIAYAKCWHEALEAHLSDFPERHCFHTLSDQELEVLDQMKHRA